MNVILLSGGSGKRLWPLSNDIRSRQFIRIFKKKESGVSMGTEVSDYESMAQRVYRQIKTVDPDAIVTIATTNAQVAAIHNQLGEDVVISAEPCGRDTFPAIALAAAYLHEVKQVSLNEAVVVCPVDTYVDDNYFECINGMYEAAREGENNLVLMGIEPTYPSEKYGYIIPITDDGINYYFGFYEKPTAEEAQKFIEAGALWNGGVFAFCLSYVLDKAGELLGGSSYSWLLENYEKLPSISFDYAIVELEKHLDVLRYSGTWKDLGTWNTLTEAMEENVVGDARMSSDCKNVHIINELGVPILGLGLHDLVISASPEGILVSDKEQSSYMRPYVDAINQRVMFSEKSWGSYRVLDVGTDSLTIKVTLNPGHRMNYHSHEKRDEVWTVIQGTGRTVIDGREQPIKPGDVVKMAVGCKHTVIAEDEGLQLIEVQLGSDITVEDKKIFKDI